MRVVPRFFSSQMPGGARRVYAAALLWFLFISVAMLWPFYTLFSRIRPFVLGMPLSLFYLAVIMVASFAVGLALYRWEDRRGVFDAEDAAAAGAADDR